MAGKRAPRHSTDQRNRAGLEEMRRRIERREVELDRRLPRKVRRSRLTPLLLGAAFGAVIVLIAVFSMSRSPAASPTPAPAATEAAILPPSGASDLTITLSDGLLTQLIQQSVQQGTSPVPLRNIQVTSGNGLLTIHGNVEVLGHNVPSDIEMQPAVQNGQLAVHVVGAKLGPLPVPQDIGRLAEGPIDKRVAAATSGLNATVTGATVTNSGLTVLAHASAAQLKGG